MRNDDEPEPITTGRSVALVAIAVALMLSGGVYYGGTLIERVDRLRVEREEAVQRLTTEIRAARSSTGMHTATRWAAVSGDRLLESEQPPGESLKEWLTRHHAAVTFDHTIDPRTDR